MTVLVGSTTAAGSNDFAGAGDSLGTRWTAVASGTASVVTVNVRAGSTFTSLTLAIYADSTNAPGAKLGETSTITDNTAGVKTTSMLSGVAITNGTLYWLMILPLGGGFNWTGVTGATAYKGKTGAAVFSDPFGAVTVNDGSANIGIPIQIEDSGVVAVDLPHLVMPPPLPA